MIQNPDFISARDLLLTHTAAVGRETIHLSGCGGRVLARNVIAAENVPAFDRSPYDGYAFRAEDTMQGPVTLRVLEEVAAGQVPTQTVTPGTATKVLTGAPIPEGADAVVKFEDTAFTAHAVTISGSFRSGDNIVRAGEDVRKGDRLVTVGQVIDPGTAGTLAAQGIARVEVYRVPKIGILSTGSELVDAEEIPAPGRIRNTNRYALEAAIAALGCQPIYLGTAGDRVEEICALLEKGVAECDAVVSTGGVSVGDYDLTPAAMERVGIEILFRGVDMKPGMACAYGVCQGKVVCALSGNPAASLTNFYAVAVPALKKLTGRADFLPQLFPIALAAPFGKKSPKTRLLRGRLELSDGTVRMTLPEEQGNVVISSIIGCNVMAIVPAGSGKLEAGTVLNGFIV